MRLNGEPLRGIACIRILLTPAKLEEGRTGNNLTTNQYIRIITLAIEIIVGFSSSAHLSLINHTHQVLVVTIDEDRTLPATQEVV